MAQNKPRSIKEAHAQGSMYYWDKKGNKQLAVTAKQLAAFKKSDLYDPDSKKGALTQWANAAKKHGVESVVPALVARREAEEKRKAEQAEAKRQAELEKRQARAREELKARQEAEKQRRIERQEAIRQAEFEKRQEIERQRIEAEKKDPIEEFAVQNEKAASHADKFERAIAYSMFNEGGYNKGEDTNYGISKASYPDLDIENITMEQAIEIYRKDWWQQYKHLPGPIAIKMFDTAINVGHHAAGHWLEDAIAEAGKDNIEGILQGIATRQLEHYQGLSNWEENKGGWEARAKRLPDLAGPPEIDEQQIRNEVKEMRDNKIPAHKIINMRSRLNERRYRVTRDDVKDQIRADANWTPGDANERIEDLGRQIEWLEGMKAQHPEMLKWMNVPDIDDFLELDRNIRFPDELQNEKGTRRITGIAISSGELTEREFWARLGVNLGDDPHGTLDQVIVKDGYMTVTPESTIHVVFHEMFHEQINRYADAGLLPEGFSKEIRAKSEAPGTFQDTTEHAFINWLVAQSSSDQLPDYVRKYSKDRYDNWSSNQPPPVRYQGFDQIVKTLNTAYDQTQPQTEFIATMNP